MWAEGVYGGKRVRAPGSTFRGARGFRRVRHNRIDDSRALLPNKNASPTRSAKAEPRCTRKGPTCTSETALSTLSRRIGSGSTKVRSRASKAGTVALKTRSISPRSGRGSRCASTTVAVGRGSGRSSAASSCRGSCSASSARSTVGRATISRVARSSSARVCSRCSSLTEGVRRIKRGRGSAAPCCVVAAGGAGVGRSAWATEATGRHGRAAATAPPARAVHSEAARSAPDIRSRTSSARPCEATGTTESGCDGPDRRRSAAVTHRLHRPTRRGLRRCPRARCRP